LRRCTLASHMSASQRSPLLGDDKGGPPVAIIVDETKSGYGSGGRTASKNGPVVGAARHSCLTAEEVAERVLEYGYNEIAEKKKNIWLKFAGYFWGPMPWLIEVAVLISGIVQDWKDMIFLFILLLVNGLMAFYEEYKAGNAIEALKNQLQVQAKVRRDQKWIEVPARELVPDDLIMIRLGDVVPADGALWAHERVARRCGWGSG